MFAEFVEGKWLQCQIAALALSRKVTCARVGVGTVRDARPQVGLVPDYPALRGIDSRILGGLVIAAAILAATYWAAATVVNRAAAHSRARADSAMILQQATANYRKARAQCQHLGTNGMGACIAEAHAEEGRARAVASLAPVGHATALRSWTDAAIDAGDRDAIVIEPACNVVARGQASLCQIQVNGNFADALAASDTDNPLLRVRAIMNSGRHGEESGNRYHAQVARIDER